ncbi:unnamed protein product [Urochloa humidicola]
MGSPSLKSWPLSFVVALVLTTVVVAAASMSSGIVARRSVMTATVACSVLQAVKAREAAVAVLLARLPAGSSPRGAGNWCSDGRCFCEVRERGWFSMLQLY